MSGENAATVHRAPTRPEQLSDAALLAQVADVLEPHLLEHVGAFYDSLEARDEPRLLFERLTASEQENLSRQQAEHVRAVVSPDTDEAALRTRARAVGRIHALAGVEMDWYVDAVAEHQAGVYEVLAQHRDTVDCAAATALLNKRFMHDLHGALQGYRDIDVEQTDVLLEVNRVAGEARTVTDLARGVLDALSALDGVLCAFIGRPDEDGVFVFEAGAGAGVEEFMARSREAGAPTVTSSEDAVQGRGPSGRAWRAGETVRCDDYRQDPTTAPWREWALRWGWRASVAVPLCDRQHAPIALLSLYARWPGYFGYATRVAMFDQVKRTVERALVALHASPAVASDVRTYADRADHLRLLRDGATEMYFQPVVDLRTGALTKVEALARLRDGDRLLAPAEFLPAYGDEELLRLFAIGLDQALARVQEWEAHGLTVGVSVNLPVASATDPRYVQAVRTALAGHPVPPGRLTLELLETGDLVGSLTQRRAAMDRFKALGVRLAQDDLGSGYSSLLRLRHFAFDEVKIDKNLVRGNDFSPRTALHFVQPITDIAHSLGLSVVLEGLESEGLIEAAAQLGVDAGQGYAIARPMPAAAVVPWARSFRLDLDPERPRTHLGALAAHVAWEHRVTAVGDVPARRALLGSGACALGAYVAARSDAHLLRAAHEEVHRIALGARGSDEHRTRWERLVSLLGEG